MVYTIAIFYNIKKSDAKKVAQNKLFQQSYFVPFAINAFYEGLLPLIYHLYIAYIIINDIKYKYILTGSMM